MGDWSSRGSGLVWPVLGLVAMVSYNSWVWWQPVNGNPAVFGGYLSELSALDQPGHAFFRAGDAITALLVVALGIRGLLVWRRRPGRPWWLLSAWALAFFAVATFLDALFALDCSPSLDDACRIAERAGTLSAGHYAHDVTSVSAQAGILTSMIAAYVGGRRMAEPVHRLGALLAACVVEVAALVTLLIMIATQVPRLGYPQAVLVLIASLWFAAVGFGVRERKPVHAR